MLRSIVAAGIVGLIGPTGPLPRVAIETQLGTILVEVDSVRAPRTAANFLRYVDAAAYDLGTFHRTVTMANQPNNNVKIEVIQAGIDASKGFTPFPAIGLERTNQTGLRHKAGTISMARLGPDTAQDQFFICVTDQPELDFGGRRNPDGQGFAAFGTVVSGMDVVKKIQASPAEGQSLKPAISIIRVTRVTP